MTPTDKHDQPESAHSLREAANSHNSMEGYAAMNDVAGATVHAEQAQAAAHEDEHHEITRMAHAYYLERGGRHGSAEEDWLRAEREVHARRKS